jgi:GAF domain-containing protein
MSDVLQPSWPQILTGQPLEILSQAFVDGVTIHDREGTLVYTNLAAARMWGFATIEDFLRAPIDELAIRYELLDPEGAPLQTNQLPGRLVLLGEHEQERSLRVLDPRTAVERWWSVRTQAVLGEGADVTYYVTVIRDVTAERNAQERLRQEEETQRFLAEVSIDLVRSLDYETMLERVTNLAVPGLADWCAVDLLDDDQLVRTALANSGPDNVAVMKDLPELRPWRSEAAGGPQVVRFGRHELHQRVTDDLLRSLPRDEIRDVLEDQPNSSVLIVPLGHERPVGALTLVRVGSGHPFTETDVGRAEELGRRAGLAIDNARLLAAERQIADRNAVLQELTAALAVPMTIEEVTDVLVRKGIAAMGATAGFLGVIDEERVSVDVLGGFGYEAEEGSLSRGLPLDSDHPLSESIRESRAVVVSEGESSFHSHPALWAGGRDGDQALVCLPLTIHGESVGGIAVTFPDLRSFTRQDMAFMTAIAQQCAQALERARLYEAERSAHERAEAAWHRVSMLSQASELLAASLDYPATFVRLAELVVRGLADLCLVDVVTDNGSIERVAAAHSDPKRKTLVERLRSEYPPSPDGAHPAASVISTGKPEFSAEMSDEFLRAMTKNEEHYRIVKEMGFQSFVCVPLRARGRIIGTITLVSTTPERRFGEDDVRLAEELARRAAVRIDYARLYHERDHIARSLQESLLPPALPEIAGFDVASYFRPAGDGYEVGGDFYDTFETTDGAWALVVGDVCGKGPEAAAVTGLARHTIRAIAAHRRHPSKVLRFLNDALIADERSDKFCTVCYVRLRPGDRDAQLTVSLGGHPPPVILRRSGLIETLGTPGTLLGVFDDVPLFDASGVLLPGDALILYTDGLLGKKEIEAFSERGPFQGSLPTMAGKSAQALADWIEQMLISSDPGERSDDVAVLILRRRGD